MTQETFEEYQKRRRITTCRRRMMENITNALVNGINNKETQDTVTKILTDFFADLDSTIIPTGYIARVTEDNLIIMESKVVVFPTITIKTSTDPLPKE